MTVTCPCCGKQFEVAIAGGAPKCICLLTGYWGCPIHGAKTVPYYTTTPIYETTTGHQP